MSTSNAVAIPDYSMATAARFIGRELGVSGWIAVDQERIDQFAACTGDRQWIHVDVERARRESPFGGPIAHGYLTLALVAALVMELGVIPRDAAGARVRMRASIASVEPQEDGRMLLKLKGSLEIEGEAKPALVAELLCMLIGKGGGSS